MSRDRATAKRPSEPAGHAKAQDATVYLACVGGEVKPAVALPATSLGMHDLMWFVESVLAGTGFPKDELSRIIDERPGQALALIFESVSTSRKASRHLAGLLRELVQRGGDIRTGPDRPRAVTLRWVPDTCYRDLVTEREERKDKGGSPGRPEYTAADISKAHLPPASVRLEDVRLSARQLLAGLVSDDGGVKVAADEALRELATDLSARSILLEALGNPVHTKALGGPAGAAMAYVIPEVPHETLLRGPAQDGRSSKLVRAVDLPKLERLLARIETHLAKLHEPVVADVQQFLTSLAGKACPTFEENVRLAKHVSGLADRFGVALFYRDGDALHEVRVHCLRGTRAVAGIFNVRAVDRKLLKGTAAWPPLIAARSLDDTSRPG